MTDVTTVPDDIAAAIDALVIPHITREQKISAISHVRRRCTTDPGTVLEALGLAPYDSLTGTRPWDRTGLGPHYGETTTTTKGEAVDAS